MFSNLFALKKFRDCKTAGPFLCPCMILARPWASHTHRAWQISFSPSLPDVSLQRGFLIYLKKGLIYRRKSRQFIQLTLIPFTDS